MTWDEIKKVLSEHDIAESQWRNAKDSPERIEKIQGKTKSYWLKKAAPARGVFRYHALNLFSWVLRLPLLKAVPQPGGRLAIANEVRRLTALNKDGFSVPKVLAHDKDWLLIEDIGFSIVKTMKQKDTDQKERQYLFQKCLVAIKSLHMKQQYLSQGFVRNMLLNEVTNEVAFIDFEDDPLEVMSLPEAQARDLLLLVNSTARFFINDPLFFQQAIHAFLKNHDPEMVNALKITTQRMQWITKVPFQKLLGHDYQKLKVGILALKDI